MKVTREIEFDLDIEYFIRKYAITKETTEEEIENYIENYLCGCDDYIYYNVSVEDVYNEYITQIKEAANNYEIDLLKIFDEIVDRMCLESRDIKWAKAIPLIREKLKLKQ